MVVRRFYTKELHSSITLKTKIHPIATTHPAMGTKTAHAPRPILESLSWTLHEETVVASVVYLLKDPVEGGRGELASCWLLGGLPFFDF